MAWSEAGGPGFGRRQASGARRSFCPSTRSSACSLAAEDAGGDVAIKMPYGDLTVSEGTLVGWRLKVGDKVKAGDTIAEIETDKTVVEIEAPISGTLSRIDTPVGTVVPMGGRIGGISP